MKIAANITKGLSIFSMVSAIGYLYVGLNRSNLYPESTILINGISQIVFASLLFFRLHLSLKALKTQRLRSLLVG
jgi:formate hydrogenlyase subunit 3/multisubunit Na+/H+ antiporter MnhD subunit|tara:strand:+ start:1655 stop:1879 length:225 start_codon:yes stop_codon:yes gene_type:complete